MKANADNVVRGVWCAVAMAGTILMSASWRMDAQEQQAPTQKPPEVYQTFFLNSSDGQQSVNDVQTDLRNLLPRARIYYVNTSNALSIRGSAEDVAMAQKIVAEIDGPRKTYRLTYTIREGGNERHLVLIVTPGERSELKQGSRVPIVTGATSDDANQNHEIQYMDIGVSVQAWITGLGDGLRLRSKIEQTSVAEEKSNVGIQDPIIHQSVIDGDTALSPGKPVMLGSMETAGGQKTDVSVVAEAVK